LNPEAVMFDEVADDEIDKTPLVMKSLLKLLIIEPGDWTQPITHHTFVFSFLVIMNS
jgi:hypothetical protein